ncbi:MAG TPA: PKD domain-containing protein [Thermoleophilaceae bacterium]
MTLAPDDAGQQTVSLDSVAQALRVSDRQYSVRGDPQGDTTITISGVTLDRLLDQAGIDPFGFEDVEISGGGRSVVLTRDQVTDVDAFPEGRPIFWVDAQGTHFLRPSAGPADANADDLLTSTDGSLRVALHSGGGLTVAATASRLGVRRGQRVTFSATVSGPGSDQAPVSWYFDDGRSARGRRVTHRFARAGSYDVTVSAGADADSVGADDVLTIQVGRRRRGGPDRKGGGTNTAVAAPDSGASSGATGAADSGSPYPSVPHRGRHPTPSPSPSRPNPEFEQAQPRPSTPELKELADAPTSEPNEHVVGILLSDASPTPTRARAEALAAARTGTPKPPQTAAGSLPPVVWGSLIGLALMGLGVWRERRGVPRRQSG